MHRLTIFFCLGIFFFAASTLNAQKKVDKYYEYKVIEQEPGGGDDIYMDDKFLYIPERNPETEQLYIKQYALQSKKFIRNYYPPKAFKKEAKFAVDQGQIYFHTDWTLTKVDMSTNQVIWETEYESAWGAQIGPVLFKDHIGIALDDLVFVVDKKTGKPYIEIEGEDLDQSIYMYDDVFIYGTFEDGVLHVYDRAKKKDRFTLKVGDQLGEGLTKVHQNFVLPSTNVQLTCVNGKTGKTQWRWKHEDLDGGCGHGFNDAPALIGQELFSLQRERGLYVFDLEGKLKEEIDFEEDVCTEWIQYKDKFIVVGEEHLFAVDPVTKKVKILASYPINDEAMPYISYRNGYLTIDSIGCYCKPWVRLFNLEKLMK